MERSKWFPRDEKRWPVRASLGRLGMMSSVVWVEVMWPPLATATVMGAVVGCGSVM